MRMFFGASTFVLLISSLHVPVVAFYPYVPHDGDTKNLERTRRAHLQHREPAIGLREPVTFPLRRVRKRRDNIYNIVKSDDPKQGNSVAIDQDGQDLSYMVVVSFGDGQGEYHLLLDSAESNTWVMARSCSSEACQTHTLLGEDDSSSLKVGSQEFSVKYGTGSASGVVASDTLHIGPLSPSISFGLATKVSNEFTAYPMDGILGIGRGANLAGSIEGPRVMDVIAASNVGSKLYGIHLSRAQDGLRDGELNFGEPNKERYDGDLNYVPAITNKEGFWELKVDDAGVDETELGIEGRTAIVDTGTSFIFMPEGDATAIHDRISGYSKSGETYTVPCATNNVIWIGFGGQKYNISIADYIGGDVGSGMCKSNIVGRQTFGEKQWLVGDVFLKNVYSVFDLDNSQVGFGVHDGGQKGSPTSGSLGESSATETAGQSGLLASTSPIPTPSDAVHAGPSATNGQISASNGPPEAEDATGPSPSPTGSTAQACASSALYLLLSALGILAWSL